MSIAFPELRVGAPLRHESLCVFPLFGPTQGGIEYRLSHVAIADQSLLVEEVSEAGSVPELLVENKGDVRVLFLEGQELIGAKQNRILNTSVLVAAHTKIKVPVSCVEQGRWGYRSKYFGSSDAHSPSKLRRSLKASVTRSVKENMGHRSDQGEVWSQVACLHATHNVHSDSAAMSDAFGALDSRIREYRENLKYVEGASGMAVAIGERIVAVDIFDQPATCEQVWDRLLSGVVFDAIEARRIDRVASRAAVEQLLAAASDLPWEPTQAVGEGVEYRAESPRGDHASALVFQDIIVHGSVMAGG